MTSVTQTDSNSVYGKIVCKDLVNSREFDSQKNKRLVLVQFTAPGHDKLVVMVQNSGQIYLKRGC